MILLDLVTFLGRTHPLFIHLPIGFILLAIVFDAISYRKEYAHLRGAVPFALLLGFASAVTACILGFMLSSAGDYDTRTLYNHKIAGISLAVMSGILFGVSALLFKKDIPLVRPFFSALAAATFGVLVYTGHQGSNLTHGSDYITIETLLQEDREKPANAGEALIFEDVVHPILKRRCGQCHQRSKRKGQLSIESLAAILKGGKSGSAVVPGDLGESELFRRISLDPSDEEFMPTDGKPAMTKTEARIIRWWIEKGAAADSKVSAFKDRNQIEPLVASFLAVDGEAEGGDLPPEELAGMNLPSLDMQAVDNLRARGLVVRVMLPKPLMLDVTLPPRSGMKMDDLVDDLKPAASNIVWLNFSDNDFTDNDLVILREMRNLRKLRLERNPVADGIIAHLENLAFLEAVNLNETKVTNAALSRLQKNPSIKRIYTWKTNATTTIN